MPQTIEERKEKARWSHILRTYGITQEQYNEIKNDRCPICLKHYSPKNPACIDHSHVSKQVRGIVCRNCNHRVIGKLEDYHLVTRLAEYLTPPFTGWIVPPKRKKKKVKKPRVKGTRRILNDDTSDLT